jgi:hypothetical protein
VETDRDQRAADDGNRVDVGNLPARIEDRDKKETEESPDECGSDNLDGDHRTAAGAPMGIGEMPLAAWTGGHQE